MQALASVHRENSRLWGPPSALNFEDFNQLLTEEDLEARRPEKSFAKPVLLGCPLSRTSPEESVVATWRKFNR